MAKTGRTYYSTGRNQNQGRTYYSSGNLAHKVEYAYPDSYEEEERRRRRLEKKRAEKRERAVMMRQMKVEAFRFMVSIVFIGAFFFTYLFLQNSINTRKNNISELKQQITTLKDSNAAAQSRIATASNIENIKDTAVNNLGMVYATSDQIIYYDVENEDYMTQYEDVP